MFIALLLCAEAFAAAEDSKPNVRTFSVTGVVKEVLAGSESLVISHDAVPGYMDAMTMPFKVRNQQGLGAVRAGDKISFQLHVTESESWIDHISILGKAAVASEKVSASKPRHHHLLDSTFTNELGQPVKLGDFHGQALGITFFFTRCPIPDYCPRLSRNFQEASRKLLARPNAPTNWHFLSVTFDPEFDTPAVLKAYAERYQYDPAHWTFLTGPLDQLAELAKESNVKFDRDGAFFNHNFRTLIIDTNGHLQMVFPTSGDLSDAIVSEIVKATAVTNAATNKLHPVRIH